MGDLVSIERYVNQVKVEQRIDNGFINGTAMCVAHGKDISDWLRTDDTWDLVSALAEDIGIKINSVKKPNSEKTRVSANYPTLVVVKRGSPENGGGTWIHPDLAVPLAQWCNKKFSIQVGRWVREWFASGQNPITDDVISDEEYQRWLQRYDLRIELKDVLRPELMYATVDYCEKNKLNPRKLCPDVHDRINERVQGYRARDLRIFGGLPLADLIRDYFDVQPLAIYSAINKLATNKIRDKRLHPLDAVNEACNDYLGNDYSPKLYKPAQNLYFQGHKFRRAKKLKRANYPKGRQLNLFSDNESA